jgi:hypothetical protein
MEILVNVQSPGESMASDKRTKVIDVETEQTTAPKMDSPTVLNEDLQKPQ